MLYARSLQEGFALAPQKSLESQNQQFVCQDRVLKPRIFTSGLKIHGVFRRFNVNPFAEI